MTSKIGSFYNATTAQEQLMGLMHPDLIANGWERVDAAVDSGAFRWDVYKNPAANNSLNTDFFVAFGRYYPSLTAGSGNPQQAMFITMFELWNATTNEATNFCPWGVGVSGTNSSGQPIAGISPRALPSSGNILNITAVNITAQGSGYTSPPTVTFGAGWQGSGAAATAVMELSAVTLDAGGSGYPASQTSLSTTITGGGGTGAVVTATTNGSGVVTGYTIVSRGTGYTSVPTITVDGGGSGATSTVTLRVLSVTVTAGGTGYNLSCNVSFSGGGGSGATATTTIDNGFAYQGLSLGSNSTQYHYTITNEMIGYSIRRDGVTDSGGVYAGIYDRILTPAQDVMPIAIVTLIGGTTTVEPRSGYGFSTREPLRGASGPTSTLIYDCAVIARNNSAAQPLIMPTSTYNVYAASANYEWVSTYVFHGRGQNNYNRGKLKNVLFTPSASGLTHGDIILFRQAGEIKKARWVNANTSLIVVD